MDVPADAIILIQSILLFACAVLFVHLEFRLNRLARGKRGADLEELIIENDRRLEELRLFRRTVEEYLVTVEERLTRSIRGVHTVRFNPFKGTGDGGNQSWCTAFLDSRGTGAVITSLHTRERSTVFAKPIEKEASPFELSDEEREAIEGALKTLR